MVKSSRYTLLPLDPCLGSETLTEKIMLKEEANPRSTHNSFIIPLKGDAVQGGDS